ncbi:hypothetical protein KOW79_000748 [Hemibagrus wyckioides]|uniref:Uncharacterized protein n=1 Tax=Hemibagrus wyckioides TaxID=337641 RepID=A0A9D3P778_9TELE|nr:uncharacterized protein LOC131351343 [Hemibagrus wyckioides]KAG7336055.1 hypothetical protein KOW79_000748 [Hemibagrus wyckioides]
MVSAENKSRKKRKDEKRELYTGWESSDADNALNDANAFQVWQKSKQQVKCRYLDERNIVLSPHLTVTSWFSGSEGNDVAETLHPRCDTSQDNAPSNKSPVALPARPNDLSQSTSDMESFQINSTSTHSMTHKQNIVHSPSPSISELKRSQPLIRWASATREQTSEESVPWRCKGFAPMNHEAKPAEPLHLCKWPAAKRLEWCQKSLARLEYLGVQSPKNVLPACRHRPVIQRPAVGHKGEQVHNRHVQKSFCWTAASKGLLNEDGTRPATLVDPCTQDVYSCLWSAAQAEVCGKELEQDSGHKLHRNNVSWLTDMLCPSGCHGNGTSSAISHDITLFHILQVLQSKPVNFPQVRGQRRLETLPTLNA